MQLTKYGLIYKYAVDKVRVDTKCFMIEKLHLNHQIYILASLKYMYIT